MTDQVASDPVGDLVDLTTSPVYTVQRRYRDDATAARVRAVLGLTRSDVGLS